MVVFWRQGYAGTSITDLVEATGLQRQSLYNVFGDKQGVFSAALKHYGTRGNALAAPLASSEAGLGDLREFILASLREQRRLDCGACMLIKTAFDPSVQDQQVKAAIHHSAELWRSQFARVLGQARRRGELPPEGNDTMLANYLFTVHNGLSALERTGASLEDIEAALDHALASLRHAP